jgi:hypothetical protein
MLKKMTIWKILSESDTLEMFVKMTGYLEENNHVPEGNKPHIPTHLTNIERNLSITL